MNTSIPELPLILTVLGLSTVLLRAFALREASPVAAVLSRWLRWIFMAFAFAYGLEVFGLSSRPFWMLAVTGFLGWFLLETIYNWVAIDALSRSRYALFPVFKENTKGDEWPNLARTIRLRDWLRSQQFRKRTALIAEVGPGIDVRSVVYENAAATIRLQILFIPQDRQRVQEAFIFRSQSSSGIHLVTDNIFLPYGGFFPENWRIERKPWTRSAATLLARHGERMEALGETFKPFQTEPEADLNAQRQELERLNTELGFLWPRPEREDHGALTIEGRYRLWKELWSLAYFGRPRNY